MVAQVVATGPSTCVLTSVVSGSLQDHCVSMIRYEFSDGAGVDGIAQNILQSPTSNLQPLSLMPVNSLLYVVSK